MMQCRKGPLAVTDSIARARNAPTPAPPDPGSKRFLRVKVDSGTDTDSDGSPDWAEFQIAARAAAALLVSGPAPAAPAAPPATGDPFNPDTNNDGIPDGQQLDFDLDLTADAYDQDLADSAATYPFGPEPRYALFPITTGTLPEHAHKPALQINDKGRVLYQSGTWCGGTWTPLVVPPGTGGDIARAYGINDHDVIIGMGTYRISADPVADIPAVYHWTSPQAQPAPVKSSNGIIQGYAAGSAGNTYDVAYAHRSVLSNDGRFNSITRDWSRTSGQSPIQYTASDGTSWYNNTPRTSTWKLPATGSAVSTETAGSDTMPFHGDPDLIWGSTVTYDENGDETGPRTGLILAPTALPALSFEPTNVLVTPGGLLALPVPYFSTIPKLYAAGTWKDAPLYTHATDMAADGTAIADRFGAAHLGLAAPILLNGKWTAIDRSAPGLPAAWKDNSVRLLDTTPGGWILAERGPLTTDEMETAVLLPIRVEGQFTNQHGVIVKKAAGVDDKSITSSEPGSTVLDRIWVMVPKGGPANSVTVKAPVSETAPLKLSAVGVDFGGTSDITTLTQRETLLSIIAGSAATGTDIPVSLKFGELESLSKPLGLKVMKSRNVALTVHLVTSRTANPDPTKLDKLGPPDFQPTKTAVEKHLNDIYGPQVNARFTGTINGPVILNWDNTNSADLGITDPDYNPIISPGNKRLDFMGGVVGPEENVIDAALHEEDADLNVYILGGAQLTAYMTLPGGNETMTAALAYGVARRSRNIAFVDGDAGLYAAMLPGRDANAELMHTVGHEIGHCIIADGHPDEGGGAAPLKGVPMSLHKERLMVSGSNVNRSDFGKLLVKSKWDEAERWFITRPSGDN